MKLCSPTVLKKSINPSLVARDTGSFHAIVAVQKRSLAAGNCNLRGLLHRHGHTASSSGHNMTIRTNSLMWQVFTRYQAQANVSEKVKRTVRNRTSETKPP